MSWMLSQQWSGFDVSLQAGASPQRAILFDCITAKYQGSIRSLHIFHLKFRLVFLGSSVHMLTPQQNPASGCTKVVLETAGSKIQTRNRYYREEYNNTHTSYFIKKKILDAIHRRACLQIVIAALHAIIRYPTDLPKFSVVVNNNLVPANLHFSR